MKRNVEYIPTEEDLLNDCNSLLINVLAYHPQDEVIDVFITQSRQRVSSNAFLGKRLFGYLYKNSRKRLEADGVFEPGNGLKSAFVKWSPNLDDTTELWNETLGSRLLENQNYYKGGVEEELECAGNDEHVLRGLFPEKTTKASILTWLNAHNFFYGNPEEFFGFRDKQFFIRKIDGGFAQADFSESENKANNMFYLLYAIDSLLRKNWRRDGPLIKANMPIKAISSAIEAKFPKVAKVDKEWIRHTRSNLFNHKLNDEMKNLLAMSAYKKEIDGYEVSIRIP